jgi:hypothetical protein
VKVLFTPDDEIEAPRKRISIGSMEKSKVLNVPVDYIEAFKKAGIKKKDLSNPEVADMIEKALG